MSPVQAKRRLCFPDGHLPSSRGRVRAVCHCGEVTTPRASTKLADEALSCEHGWFAAPDGCAICRQKYEDVRPWEAFTVLDDGGREVWVCQDTTACSDRHEARRSAEATQIAGTDSSADSG